jgi:hypothetical protein
MTKEERKLKTITEKFGGVFNPQGRNMQFSNPTTLKSRADALDMLFCLIGFDDWMCDETEPLEALKKFIENCRKGSGMNSAVQTLELLLRKTEENGHTIALIYPDETVDFIRGYAAGQIDAFRLALDHIKDIEEE